MKQKLAYLLPSGSSASGITGLKHLAQDLKVMKTLEVRVNTLSLGSVIHSQRDKNINVLRRFSQEFKFHEFLPVDSAVPFFHDADIMDACELRIYENIPMGEYQFCPFETADMPSLAQLLVGTFVRNAWVTAAHPLSLWSLRATI
jgi:hypothetical protein